MRPSRLAERLRRTHADASAERLLAEAVSVFGDSIVASSSFQSQSVPLLHMIGRVCPDLPVYFLDTGFHFPETLRFRDELADRFGLNVVTVRPALNRRALYDSVGDPPYETDPDRCCHINKVEPMQRVLRDRTAWISGVRADQTAHRGGLERVTAGDGHVRIHPMLHWTARDIWTYVREHDLPSHPLLERGYASVGCAPCTRPPSIAASETPGAGERSGRWAGSPKTECGLHTGLGGTST